ncbi:hypothetical protein ACFL4U_01285 [Candidatus Neomarinimicrobiota bacterium]
MCVPFSIYIARIYCRYAGQARLVTPEYSKSIKMPSAPPKAVAFAPELAGVLLK